MASGGGHQHESILSPKLKQELTGPKKLFKFKIDGALGERNFWLTPDETQLQWRRDRKFFAPIKTLELSTVNLVTLNHYPGNAHKTEQVPYTVSLFTAGGGASVTIGFSSQQESVDWNNALRMLTVDRKPTADPKKAFYRKAWAEADKDKSGTLDVNEVLKLLDILDIKMDKRAVKKVFSEMDQDGSKSLDFDEFTCLLDHLKARVEVEQLIKTIAKSADATEVSAAQLAEFLSTAQGEPTTEADAQTIIDKFQPASTQNPRMLTAAGLADYLDTPANCVFNPAHNEVYQDMTLSLSDYWCSSSHNTYLEGHQLRGHSSSAMYIKTLGAGCRCVELDCWDGPEAPIIYHGYTLTSKISFEDAIQAINDSAFVNSPYPITLSIEMHCTYQQQKMMVEIMKRIFGDKLATPLDPSTEYLPSPEELKNKILIKGKKLKDSGPVEEESESEDEDDDEADDKSADKAALKDKKAKQKAAKEPKLSQEFSDLVYLSAVHFKNFETSIAKGKGYEMSSFAEAKHVKLASTQKSGFIEYNKKQLSRIYPAGVRFDSSNYSPYLAWSAGCQIVALNWQTYDEPLWSNQAKFRDNGNCGYLLKPVHMRRGQDTESALAMVNQQRHTLTVLVMSGQQLPKPDRNDFIKDIIDPFVEVNLITASDLQTDKTPTVDDNGFNPVWGHKSSFTFTGDLSEAALRFVLKEEGSTGDDFIAQYTLFLDSMRQGYRMVPLFNHHGFEIPFSHLFCHFKLE